MQDAQDLKGTNLLRTAVFSLAVLGVVSTATGGDLQLPPEVTPALRSACESDVRRLCIGTNPTIAKVNVCVAAKFMQLGRRCQVQIALAGLKP
jgi:hypothetical protein